MIGKHTLLIDYIQIYYGNNSVNIFILNNFDQSLITSYKSALRNCLDHIQDIPLFDYFVTRTVFMYCVNIYNGFQAKHGKIREIY